MNNQMRPAPSGAKAFASIVVIALFGYIGYRACNGGISKPRLADTRVYTAISINEYYQQNEVKADKDLKGKRIRVAGTISGISKNAFGEVYITLSTGNMFQAMLCHDLDEKVASCLHKGQEIVIEGTCTGLFMQSVGLEDCEEWKQ